MEQIRVVARYRNGSTVKGSTSDFFPNKEVFHIQEESGEVVAVRRDELKALFFVKTFEGDPAHVESSSFEGKSGQGRKIRVSFLDGETLAGFTMGFSRDRPGFFLFPTDEESNNSRIFVVTKAIRSVTFGD